MRRYLVVAHKTLGGAHLLDAVRDRISQGPSQFFLLVPVTTPHNHAWTDGQLERAAQGVLDEGLARFREAGADVGGAIGDANPVYAVESLLRDDSDFDEILLSTLPAGPSKWLKVDVPARVARHTTIPVIHLVAEREAVS